LARTARLFGAGRRACAVACALVLLPAVLAARSDAAPRLGLAGFDRAQMTYAAMLKGFRQRGAYTETPSGPSAYVWPLSQALAASLAMAQLPHAGHYYLAEVESDLNALQAYWLPGPPGLYSALPGRPDAFYDDNEWIGLDLVAASQLLHRRGLLFRAGALFALVQSGWSGTRGVCPGGVYWQRAPADSDRAAVSTANGALLALRLYQATHRRRYLREAQTMTAWLLQCLQRPDGLIANDIRPDGVRTDRAWSYNQGATIADLVLLSQVTGRPSYLGAQRIAAASLRAYGKAFANEPRVFVAIFFRDLALLDAAAPDALYRDSLQAYTDAQWRSGRNSATGLFGTDLLDQAGMVQLYAQLATRP
jgi:hypothetical protein